MPESRSKGIKMYKAINTVINASPPEFTQNLETFQRSIHQWASSLQGHKSLTVGSQLSLKASFVENVTFDQYLIDVKEMGERVLQFAQRIKREEPVLLYHQQTT